MAYPTNRTAFKAWIKQNADENNKGSSPFSGDAKLEVIIDSVLAEYSKIKPLLSLGSIEISTRYAILPDDWVDGSELNTSILYSLQRGKDPTLIDLGQAGYDQVNNSLRFSSNNSFLGNGYGLGTGGASRQEPLKPTIPSQLMPESSSAFISNAQKKVFVLPALNFSNGVVFEIRYNALHKIQDAAGQTPAMMTVPKEDLLEVFDRIFARAVKARIFAAINANETEGEDKFDINRLEKLAGNNPFINKY